MALRAVVFLCTGVALSSPTIAQTIAAEDCRRVLRHVPDADVAYRPGVDMRGRRVAPADLAPPVTVLPERFALRLGVDVRRRLGLPRDLDLDLPLGVIEVRDNVVYFNGTPLEADAAGALASACAAARRR